MPSRNGTHSALSFVLCLNLGTVIAFGIQVTKFGKEEHARISSVHNNIVLTLEEPKPYLV